MGAADIRLEVLPMKCNTTEAESIPTGFGTGMIVKR